MRTVKNRADWKKITEDYIIGVVDVHINETY